jgi:hypothetical protein
MWKMGCCRRAVRLMIWMKLKKIQSPAVSFFKTSCMSFAFNSTVSHLSMCSMFVQDSV